jgi:hypothetical protein
MIYHTRIATTTTATFAGASTTAQERALGDEARPDTERNPLKPSLAFARLALDSRRLKAAAGVWLLMQPVLVYVSH